MSREAQQPATPMSGSGGFSRSNSGASASGAGRQRGTMLRTLSTTASDAALVAQLQVRAESLGASRWRACATPHERQLVRRGGAHA